MLQSEQPPTFADLLGVATRSAIHLEMRDGYAMDNEHDGLCRWRESGQVDSEPCSPYWQPWTDLVVPARARGVVMRRVRIVSLPASEYIRYEYALTEGNLAVGEDVRWLERRRASDLLLPGNDLWIFDEDKVLFNHFDGDGGWTDAGLELREEPALVKQCVDAVEAVWQRAVPHAEFEIH